MTNSASKDFAAEQTPETREAFLVELKDVLTPELNEAVVSNDDQTKRDVFYEILTGIRYFSHVTAEDFDAADFTTHKIYEEGDDASKYNGIQMQKRESLAGSSDVMLVEPAEVDASQQDGRFNALFEPSEIFAKAAVETILNGLDVESFSAKYGSNLDHMLESCMRVADFSTRPSFRLELFDHVMGHTVIEDLPWLRFRMLNNFMNDFGVGMEAADVRVTKVAQEHFNDQLGMSRHVTTTSIYGRGDDTRHYIFTNLKADENGMPPVFFMVDPNADAYGTTPEAPAKFKQNLKDERFADHRGAGYVENNFKYFIRNILEKENLSEEERDLLEQAQIEFLADVPAPAEEPVHGQ